LHRRANHVADVRASSFETRRKRRSSSDNGEAVARG
jgi:hypothetical protein